MTLHVIDSPTSSDEPCTSYDESGPGAELETDGHSQCANCGYMRSEHVFPSANEYLTARLQALRDTQQLTDTALRLRTAGMLVALSGVGLLTSAERSAWEERFGITWVHLGADL